MHDSTDRPHGTLAVRRTSPHRGLWTLPALVLLLLLNACSTTSRTTAPSIDLVDAEASRETRALYANLKRLAPERVLFGHQDDLAYGVTWKNEPGRSDVKDVTGAYPAVHGFDLGRLSLNKGKNIDSLRFEDMRRWILEAYRQGGVITISWHAYNPVTGGNTWDTTRAVHAILPGGSRHDAYKATLDRLAGFLGSLKTGRFRWLGFGRRVPIIFRPFHEHTGSWFWWGADHCSRDEYIALWRFTVEYLRDAKGLHNLLYAYSTDVFDSEEEYLERYPGDAYVDLMGFDDYHSLKTDDGIPAMTQRLRQLVQLAEASGKVPALTETGLEGIPYPTWWTERLLASIKTDSVARRIAYVHVWRNANEADKPGHHYAPYPGHPSAADFVRFYQDPLVLFADQLPRMYRRPR